MKKMPILLLCLILLLACVPTPEEEVVFGDAQTDAVHTMQATESYPETVSEVILDNPGNRVMIDAAVTVKATAPFTEIAYEKMQFTDRELNDFLTVLIGDAPVYKVPERTQDVIKTEMEACVYTMEHTEPGSDDYQAAKEELKDLQEEYRTASSEVPDSEPVERRMQDVDGARYFIAIAQYEGHTVELFCWKNLMHMRDATRLYPRYDHEFDTVPTSDLDQAQAEQTAIALAAKLAPQLALWKTDHRWNETATADSYCMTFRPAVNGIAAAERYVLGRDDSMLVADIWHADTLIVEIDREGITQVNWRNPGKASQLPQTDVGLLSFEQILSNAKQQLKNQYAWLPEDVEFSGDREIYVDRIVLEYAVVMWRDHGDVYKLIPVWNFYGGERVETPDFGTVEKYGVRTDIVHVSIDAATGKVLPN